MMSGGSGPRILALWSAPRSRSTAFLRMMAERGDYTVLHEPFSHVADFGTAMVADREVHDEADLISALVTLAEQRPVFFKDTTDFDYPVLLASADFLARTTHTFLIRDPREAIASHFALNPNLQRDEIGFARLAAIYDAVAACTGADPVVLDSADLVAWPEQAVRVYCERVGIPFRPEALCWQPGLREEWRRTRRWHEATSQTRGFTRVAVAYDHTVDTDPLLAGYLEYHLPFYTKLYARRIVVGPG